MPASLSTAETVGNTDGISSANDMLDMTRFRDTALVTTPYEHLVVPGLVRDRVIDNINRDFPPMARPGSFALQDVKPGPAFNSIIAALDSDEFEQAIAAKFETDIAGKPKMFTVRGRCRLKDGQIHTDTRSKIITVLIYLNTDWSAPGGRLRVLNSGTDVNDYASEVPPVAGTLLAFKRSEKSFHGHEPFEGERRAIQFNWITDVATRDRELSRHRFSARLKRLNPFG